MQAFHYGLKFWPPLGINETSFFFKESPFEIKLEVSVHNLRNTFKIYNQFHEF